MFIFKVVLVLELDQLRHEEAVLTGPVVIEKILSTELTKLIPVIQITRYLRWLQAYASTEGCNVVVNLKAIKFKFLFNTKLRPIT